MVIHYICRGNAFRSIIADAYTKSLGIPGLEVISSGTAASDYREDNIPTYARVCALLASHELKEFTKDHYADDLTQQRIDRSDVVVCLNEIVLTEAASKWKLPKQTYVWDIADIGESEHVPEGETEHRAFMEATYQAITARVDSLVHTASLLAKLAQQ
jgi:protein-tyrosine-phosphatase